MTKRIRVFANGDQAGEWKAKNCENCAKRYRHDKKKYHCRWEREIDTGWLIDGLITDECAQAIGYIEAGGLYTWDCPILARPGDPPRKGRGAVPGQYNLFHGGKNGSK